MPRAPFPSHQLSLLFDRDAAIDSVGDAQVWMPADAQLNQWVLAALSQALPDDLIEKTIEVSLSCVDAEQMRELNAQYRSKDRTTNVLSFPADMPLLPSEDNNAAPLAVLGDVVVCPAVLVAEAIEQDKTLEHHWAHMVVHSVLHLNGLDHEDERTAQAMESLEIQILSTLGITNPYLAASANQS